MNDKKEYVKATSDIFIKYLFGMDMEKSNLTSVLWTSVLWTSVLWTSVLWTSVLVFAVIT